MLESLHRSYRLSGYFRHLVRRHVLKEAQHQHLLLIIGQGSEAPAKLLVVDPVKRHLGWIG
jgi:hypothetical protein